MKWIKQDCYGNEQTWYSGDTLQKIRQATIDVCCADCMSFDDCKECPARKIIQIIESEI